MRDILETKSVQELLKLKEECDDIYYNTGQNSVLSDHDYDLLCDYLRKNRQKLEVGSKIRDTENKVKLPPRS